MSGALPILTNAHSPSHSHRAVKTAAATSKVIPPDLLALGAGKAAVAWQAVAGAISASISQTPLAVPYAKLVAQTTVAMTLFDQAVRNVLPSLVMPYGMTPAGVSLAVLALALALALAPKPRRRRVNDGTVLFRF